MVNVTMKYLKARGNTVCSHWVGNTFTVGSFYSSNGVVIETNYNSIPVSALENRSGSVFSNFRVPYKNELKGGK